MSEPEYGTLSKEILQKYTIDKIMKMINGKRVVRNEFPVNVRERMEYDIKIEYKRAKQWLRSTTLTFAELRTKMLQYVTGKLIASPTNVGPLHGDHVVDENKLAQIIKCGIITSDGQRYDPDSGQINAYLCGEFICGRDEDYTILFKHCSYMCVKLGKYGELSTNVDHQYISTSKSGGITSYLVDKNFNMLSIDEKLDTYIILEAKGRYNLGRFVPSQYGDVVVFIMWGKEDILSHLIEKASKAYYIYGNINIPSFSTPR